MESIHLSFSILPLLATCLFSAQTEAGHWNRFRGPSGAGRAAAFKPSVQISTETAKWKTALPAGKSSPVLWEDRIFLTGVEAERLVTLAVDTDSGEVLWKRFAPEVPLERVHRANSVAASTPCVDKERVYVYFGSYGLLCYDHDGLEQWKKPIPTPKSMYGVATSPILHGPLLILVLDDDTSLPGSPLSCSRVVALDKVTGEAVWETPRPYNRGAWSSPMIWQHAHGADLVVLGNGRAYGYDPATGTERWYVNGFAREPIAVPVAGNRYLYLSVSMQGGRGDIELDPEPFWMAMLHFDANHDGRIGRDEITDDFTLPFRPELPPGHPGFGLPLPADPRERRKRQEDIFNWRDRNKDGFWTKEEFTDDMRVGHGQPNLAAIRPGGQGDITESHVVWNLRRGIPEIPSPVYYEDRLYLVRSGGVLSCVHAETGEMVYQERLGASGQYSASPVIANGHVYLFSERGIVTVVKCGDTFAVTHQADLGASVAATAALDQHSLYLRTDEALLAFR
jgi:outer membrane protein assembly factor BamB